MTKKEAQRFEKLLLSERERLVGSIRNIEDASRHESGRDRTGDLTSYAETGTDNFELETALNIAGSESEWLKDVTEALERIKHGNYGICEICEKEIPRKRLEVFPSAKYCVACKEMLEKKQQAV
ncbi:MAG: TraR/DksA C4-type zinc finger protein [Candidatus Hydrogenedentes bacterium]|nr:TraR/DksA C4-type zinc finger protein [Candidatus Hydrogenedentota bacterium]